MKKKLFIWLVNIHKSKYIFLLWFGIFLSLSSNAQVWTLQQCIDTAQVYNKNLQISRNNMALGNEKHSESKANLIPKISLNADYKYFAELPYQLMPQSAFGGPEGMYKEVQMGVPHNINANLQMTIPLYNPQLYGAIKASKIASELNSLQYKKTEEHIYFEISNLYYNLQILSHQKAFIDSNLINTTKLLDNLHLLYTEQMIKKSDVSKVELQKEQLTTQIELVRNNYEQVLNALKFAMGIPYQQTIQIDTEIEKKELIHYTPISSIDLQLVVAQNKLLSSELSTLKNSRLPTVSIFGNYGQTGFGYDEKPNNFLNFYPTAFVGLQLSVPVFNGTVTKCKINQKKLEIKNNQIQFDMAKEQNQMLIENATRVRLVNRQNIENSQNQIEMASTIYNEMVLQQREGTATLTDILMADNALREAQNSYLIAIIEFLKADLELKKLTGNISLIK